MFGTVGLFDLRMLGVARGISLRALHRMIPVGLAGINMLLFYATTARAAWTTSDDALPPLRARVFGAVSLACSPRISAQPGRPAGRLPGP